LEGISARRAGIAILLVEDVTASERRRRAEFEFVSNAAHELRSPLAGITSALEVLENGAKNDPGDRDLFLGHIQRESERLTKLTSALLLLASIQSGEDPPGLRLVELEPLLSDVASELQPEPGVEVEVSCPRELAALVDPDLLRQALWNVASNSTAHTVKGRIALRGRDLGRAAELEVADTGAGMSQAEQSSAFDRFYRVGRRSGNSFGLGLAIAQAAVHALSGTITLESELGVGTTVRIQLPSARLVRR
jgi:signal transduction histidine kinase